ncbi:MAG: helix-turn-helix transcriptional regulator [Methylobacteriaceae bacterium]|nr:helix-turn-helix transcriptional regulator [Methylobacteriaceae bacterium]
MFSAGIAGAQERHLGRGNGNLLIPRYLRVRHDLPQGGTAVIPARSPDPGLDAPERCRLVSEVLSRVGDKWSVLVVMTLGDRPRRFSELKRAIGSISQRMLTLTLRGLERDGLVARVVTPSIPPRVDYELTPLGKSLRGPVEALGRWAMAHQGEVQASRAAFDASSGTGGLA